MEVKIKIDSLKVSYDSVEALKGFCLDVYKNEILSIIGPANSGKSTLLLSINRMIDRIKEARVEGKIFLDSKEISRFGDVEDLRRMVGMVFALPIALPMSIRDNVLFGVRFKKTLKKSQADQVVESSLRSAFLWDEVKDRLDLFGTRLSGGQQQRLCIARTLAVKPEVIMFDEPCSGLDPISTAMVEDAMQELKKEHTIILVTNNTKQAARVSDRTAFLLMGELIEADKTSKIFTSPSNKKTEEYVTGKFG